MGYQITFVPTAEKMESYKPYNDSRPESYLTTYKYELMSYCMKKHNDSVFAITKYLKNTLSFIASAIEKEEQYDAYERWKNDPDHELWYTGWEFSHESYFEKEEIINRNVKDLLILTDLVETPDYFKDIDNFYKKLEDVMEVIDGFVDIMQDIAIHGIIEDMREFELKDNEDDYSEELPPVVEAVEEPEEMCSNPYYETESNKQIDETLDVAIEDKPKRKSKKKNI
jgi:hypothetical protein